MAQLTNYKGAIWATWDPAAPSFTEYLGDFRHYLDQTFDGWDGSDGGTEILGGIQKWRVPCNWKFPAENFGGDSYHVQWSHMSAIKTDFASGAGAKPETKGSLVSPGNGHVLICFGPKIGRAHV